LSTSDLLQRNPGRNFDLRVSDFQQVIKHLISSTMLISSTESLWAGVLRPANATRTIARGFVFRRLSCGVPVCSRAGVAPPIFGHPAGAGRSPRTSLSVDRGVLLLAELAPPSRTRCRSFARSRVCLQRERRPGPIHPSTGGGEAKLGSLAE
jgi:hypothetical protein